MARRSKLTPSKPSGGPPRQPLKSPSFIDEAVDGQVALDRNELELLKLRLEVRNLRRPPLAPLLYPAILNAAPAILLALVTIWITMQSGILDARHANLESQRALLTIQTTDLEKQKEVYSQEAAQLRAKVASLHSELDRTERIVSAERRLAAIDGTTVRILPASRSYEISLTPFLDWSMFPASPNTRFDAKAWPLRNRAFQDIQELPDVHKLELHDVLLDEDALAQLASARVTNAVVFEDNGLTNERVARFPIWPTVTHLSLTRQEFSDPTRLAGFASLIDLNLSETAVDDEGLAKLRPILGSLEYLRLDHTKVTDSSAELIRSAGALKLLSIVGCNVSDRRIESLQDHPSLSIVVVSSSTFSDERLRQLNLLGKKCVVLADTK